MNDDRMLVKYTIESDDGESIEFDLDIALPEVSHAHPDPATLPDWTRLEYHKCSHCPLSEGTTPHCPVAAHLVDYGRRAGQMISFERVMVTIQIDDRVLAAQASAHEALRSILGLVMATSGCPHMSFFKPLARYHVPLADMELTILRSMGFYLLGQYFNNTQKPDWDTSFEGLIEIYKKAQTVNQGIANRLRNAQVFKELNWLAELDTFAGMMPISIERSLLKAKVYFQN